MRVARPMLALLLGVALLLPPHGFAHPTGTHVGFVSTVSGLEPPQLGVLAQVLGGHERLSVRNLGRKTVLVFDRHGDVALRLPPGESGTMRDPRIGSTGPPPTDGEFVRDWRISAEADGQPFEIVGFLGYRAAPGEDDQGDSGSRRWTIVLAVGAIVLAAALALPLLRREGEGARRSETPTE